MYTLYTYVCARTQTHIHMEHTGSERERERERAEVFKQGKQNNVILLKENKSRGSCSCSFHLTVGTP